MEGAHLLAPRLARQPAAQLRWTGAHSVRWDWSGGAPAGRPRGRPAGTGHGTSIRPTGGTCTVRAPGVPPRITVRRLVLFVVLLSYSRFSGLATIWM
jgi:hypothetical protein